MKEHLCMGCMEDKGTEEVCPFCGYSESAPRIHTYLAPRSVIGKRYLVGKVLSYNGEGVTYIGYDTIANRKVDIREYFPDTLADRGKDGQLVTVKNGCQIPFKTYMSDFRELMEKLSHMRTLTCLAQILGLEEQNGTVYAMMEHLGEETLQQYLDKRGLMLTWTETSDLLLPVIKTLNLLHQEGIIHRGVSASTLYMNGSGGLKLDGFSISAVRAARTELVAELFPGYSAPEQYSTVSPHGTWTDVYAISALLYTCVTGQCPPEALIRSAAKELPPPRERNETVPPRVSLAILQGLSLQPEDRIRTLGDLVTRIGGPFQTGSGDAPTISIPAATRPSQPRPRPSGQQTRGRSPAPGRQGGSSSENPPQATTVRARPEPVKKADVVVEGTSDRRLLINSMLITLPILLLILIFTFWYLFGNRRQGEESSEELSSFGGAFSSSAVTSSSDFSFPAVSSSPPVSSGLASSEPSSEESSEEESSDNSVMMLNLVGQRYEDAVQNDAYKAVCTFEEPEYIYSESDAAGIIVWQSVAADTPVEPGVPVRLKVSRGSQYVKIPPYEKLTEAEYTQKLDELGIHYTVSYQEESIYPSGYVVGLDHLEGSKYDLEKATVIEVYVCKKDE